MTTKRPERPVVYVCFHLYRCWAERPQGGVANERMLLGSSVRGAASRHRHSLRGTPLDEFADDWLFYAEEVARDWLRYPLSLELAGVIDAGDA